MSGHIVGLAILERENREREAAAARSKRSFYALWEKALKHGFTEVQAPFAAIAAAVLGKHATPARVRARCVAMYPEIFNQQEDR